MIGNTANPNLMMVISHTKAQMCSCHILRRLEQGTNSLLMDTIRLRIMQ